MRAILERCGEISYGEVLRAANRWVPRRMDYGVVDCCQFTDFMLCELHGGESRIPWAYGSEREACRLIVEHGGSMASIVAEALKTRPVPLEQLEPGDVAIWFDADGLIGVGLYTGRTVLTLNACGGIVELARNTVIEGFKCQNQPPH